MFDPDVSFLLVLARNPFQSHPRWQFLGEDPEVVPKTVSKGTGTYWAVSAPRTSRGREPDGGVIGVDPALAYATIRVKCLNKYVASVFSTTSSLSWLWTTSTDVSPEVLTFVRLADYLRWLGLSVPDVSESQVPLHFSGQAGEQCVTGVNHRWEENLVSLVIRVTEQ